MSKSREVAVVNSNQNAVMVPDYLRDYEGPMGTENMEREDITIPRLKIAQGLTPEVKEGLVADGDLFVNLGAQVVAPKGTPLPFVALAYGKEYILWRPRKDQGGGILARAKPVWDEAEQRTRYKWDKPNESFNVKLEGIVPVTWKTAEYIDQDGLDQWGSENPGLASSNIAATGHLNFVVALPTFDDMITAFSFSRTTTRAGRDLNGLLRQGRAPMFARVFNATTFSDKRQNNDFNNVKIMPAGLVQVQEQFEYYKGIASQFSRGFVVDQSDQSDERAEVDHDAV